MTAEIKWEYEDQLEIDMTDGMFRASIVDIVRLYPYVEVDNKRVYLEVPQHLVRFLWDRQGEISAGTG